MQSSPVIYVSHITNLSDARYCAGMGAEFLGVVVDPAHPDYVSPEAYQQIIGWVSGPTRVAELGSQLPVDLEQVRSQYAADYFHLGVQLIPALGPTPVPLLVEITFREYFDRLQSGDWPAIGIAYWIVTDVPDSVALPFATDPPVLIARHSFPGLATDFLSSTHAAGVALQGSRESAPGLKDYDQLATVLEELNG